MTATTDQEREEVDWVAVPTAQEAEALDVELDLFDLDDEHALLLWRFGGYGTAENFPGARIAILTMMRGTSRSTRKDLARIFASLAPHAGFRAVLALLYVMVARPAPVSPPAPAPRVLAPQRRCGRLTPARAP